jgi:hypothetical protein
MDGLISGMPPTVAAETIEPYDPSMVDLLFDDGPLAGKGLKIPAEARDEFVAFLRRDGLVGVASPDHVPDDHDKVKRDAPWMEAMALYRKTSEGAGFARYRVVRA